MKFLLIIILLFSSLKLFAELRPGTEVYQVRKVSAPLTLELEDGRSVTLGGVKVIDGQEIFLENFMKSVAAGRNLIIKQDKQNSSIVYVFLFGNAGLLDELNRPHTGLVSGFLDVKTGFLGPSKGIALNLNAYLVRRGFVSVDTSNNFTLKRNFINQQEYLQSELRPFSKKQTISLTEAINIGRLELKRVAYPYSQENTIVQADDFNSYWYKHVKSSPAVLKTQHIKDMSLGSYKYWAIYYAPKKGGDAFVFIDRANGEIIGILLGE